MKNTNRKPGKIPGQNQRNAELLAPAGGMPQLLAAVENGADAVYLGGRFFNARMNADNFSMEELKEAIDYAHLRNVKVYLTMNVLIKDEELKDAVDQAVQMYGMGIDALIVQDLGLADALQKILPDLPLHFSTQGTLYNATGVRTAAMLGFRRVVLARELSLTEIKTITAERICDIEVFVHGALCLCYSGQCQMSRAIGGRSANRGECAQPCRLPYRDKDGNEGYFLSPKDFCAIDQLGELIEAGVSAFKIEGRMKSAEYVATVVRIYRKYLDLALRGKPYAVAAKDKEDLMQVFNRGGFTQGYLLGDPGQKLLSGRIPKHQGVLVGKVLARPKGKDLVDISFTKPLTLGDGIEIQGREINGNILTYYKPMGKNRAKIGDFKGDIRSGDLVYRTSSKELYTSAKDSFTPEARRISRTIPVAMKFRATFNEPATLELVEGHHRITVFSQELCQRAENRSLDQETVRRQLSKTGGTPFSPVSIQIEIDAGISMPLAAINAMRREASERLVKMKTQRRSLPVYIMPQYPKLQDSLERTLPKDLLELPPITKGREDVWLEENFPKQSVMVNNLGWIKEILENGQKVFAGPGLNIYNGAAASALKTIGVIPAAASYEASSGNIPLMTTEFHIQSDQLTDRKGKRYRVHKNRWDDKWIIKADESSTKD